MPDDVVLSKIAIIERCLRRIREEYLGHETELATNLTRQDSIILNLLRACEAAIDIAMHLVRIKGLGLPQDSRDAFNLLLDANLITHDLCPRLQAMVGFRNIAIHDYQKLNLDIVRAVLNDHLADFEAYCDYLFSRDDTGHKAPSGVGFPAA